MTIESLRAAPTLQRTAAPINPVRRTAPAGNMCIVVNELGEGEGTALVRNLGRRGTTRVVLLARRAARRELVQLLGGGLRGAVVADPRRMQIMAGGSRPMPAPEPAPVLNLAPAPQFTQLTARELGVLKLVADGRSNRQIGDDLGLSALTVKSHLARISRKLGTGDRAELVATVIRGGLLP
ncbi:helix-turn-helix transcriptional regulator [Pengzhenrongella sp.]|uniref:helix-turn-helix transcriptional regulator n=1 Tax=Pengzhenrongella sp. TaxID=2888820 RepID=UPI0039C971B2